MVSLMVNGKLNENLNGFHVVNFFYLVGDSVSAKQLKGYGSEERNKGS